MSWITLAESDVQTRLAGAELAALKTAALASGQASPLTETIAEVVQEVRGYVAACNQNRLGLGDTIPQELKADALAIIRYRLCTRLPVKSLLTDERKQEYRDAIDKLKACARCEFRIEQPATLSTQVVGGPAAAVVSENTNLTATRTSMRGL